MKLKNTTIVILVFAITSLIATGCRKNVTNENKHLKKVLALSSIYANKMNLRLARSVNLGNALEAPNEGDWGMVIRKEYLDSIAAAGFTAVRIPIKWSAHAEKQNPFTIDPNFINRVDEVVGWSLHAGLNAIIDFHHYDELTANPLEHKSRWLGIWEQISKHFRNTPDSVFFELLNEPHDQLTSTLWNRYLAEAVNLIRQDNPTRIIIAGPVNWNAFDQLNTLVLPSDTMLIVTFHYYLPFHFTHQGADWVDGSDAWLGTTWSGTDNEKQVLEDDFDATLKWAETYNRPLFLGEFGSYSKADSLSRLQWTTFIRETAESKNISWAYWEFGAGFGIFNREQNRWKNGLLQALIPQ